MMCMYVHLHLRNIQNNASGFHLKAKARKPRIPHNLYRASLETDQEFVLFHKHTDAGRLTAPHELQVLSLPTAALHLGP